MFVIKIKKYKDKLKKYRTCGLEKDGEYSDENLVFKVLRRNGYIEKLFDFENKYIDKQLSLKEQVESDEYSNIVNGLIELSNKNLTLINEPKPKGQKIFNPNTEILQNALILIGYPLPKFGVDGKFGKETQTAVESFESENGLTVDGKVDSKDFKKMSEIVLKRKPNKLENIKPKDPTLFVPNEPNLIKSSDKWKTIAANYIAKKESFSKKASDDEGTQRGGYGSDKVIKNGETVKVTKGTVITQQEAMNTLTNYSIPMYSKQIISDLGQHNWDKLNNNQKAALVSLGYNVGMYFVSARNYGKKIKSFIEKGDLRRAGETIYTDGPKSGAKSGFLRGLEKRRKEESQLFLTPEQ